MHFATGKMILCIKKQIKTIFSITIQGGNLNIIITKVPPGFAPDHIREAWLGVTLPVASDEDKAQYNIVRRSGTKNGNGYEVLTEKAIEALREADKNEAAEYWEYTQAQFGNILIFKKECCTEVTEV